MGNVSTGPSKNAHELKPVGSGEISECPMKSKDANPSSGNRHHAQPLSSKGTPRCPLGYGKRDGDDNNATTVPHKTSRCPLGYGKQSSNNIEVGSVPSRDTQGECPMRGGNGSSGSDGKYRNPFMYNVYSQRIDPLNQMPSTANQQPAPNQTTPLSVDRVQSSIPKGGTDDAAWVYPSPQMFWNALVRKNKTEGASEEDMETVVAVHNSMNENTWRQVLAWEALHPVPSPDRAPKLLRFLGRPHDLSPKARLKILFNHPAPFDRHDWVVDRGGEEVRYVIDYYHDESAVDLDKKPQHLKDISSMKSIKVDVRPAVDSVGALVDRMLLMPVELFKGTTAYNPPPFFPTISMKSAEDIKEARVKKHWDDIQMSCVEVKEKLSKCSTDEECGAASVALQRCVASVVCPDVAKDFDKCVQANVRNDRDIEAAFGKMLQCIQLFELDSRRIQEMKKKS